MPPSPRRTNCATVPDFRTLRAGQGTQNLFHISTYNTAKDTSHLHKLVRTLSRPSTSAEPSKSHDFLGKIASSGHLLRHYTQNVDCIEKLLPALWNRTIQLHGRIDQARCQCCGSITPFFADSFTRDEPPACEQCEAAALERESRGKRRIGVGRLRPNIVFYGEENFNADAIGNIATQDLRKSPDIVMVPGAKRLVREFCRGVQDKGELAVWINKEPIASGLERCFNLAL